MTFRDLEATTGKTNGFQPEGFPWSELDWTGDLGAWVYGYHEAAHVAVAEYLGLIPEYVLVAWRNGSNEWLCKVPLGPRSAHRLYCAAGGAMTHLMWEEYGDRGLLQRSKVDVCTVVDRERYRECGGVSDVLFFKDLATVHDLILTSTPLRTLIDSVFTVLYERWRKHSRENTYHLTGPLRIEWKEILEER